MPVQTLRYSMCIQRSDEDAAYVVSFPEWGDTTHTHGATCNEVARTGQDVLADLIARWQRQGRPLPEAQVFAT